MSNEEFSLLFDQETLKSLFPPERADRFFDALFGTAAEGAYDISLHFLQPTRDELHFALHLRERPGKCLGCHLTQGLPQVFARHPVIDMEGLVREIDQRLGRRGRCAGWRLGRTQHVSHKLHAIPLYVTLARQGAPGA